MSILLRRREFIAVRGGLAARGACAQRRSREHGEISEPAGSKHDAVLSWQGGKLRQSRPAD